ncbi:Chromatin remodeling protein EBS [Bienertia sinuspersici]
MVGRRASVKTKRGDDDTEIETKKTKSLRQIEQEIAEQQHINSIENDHEYDEDDGARPIGEAIRVYDDGVKKTKHFKAFEFDGNQFQLEDAVLVAPEEGKVKPSVTIIKDIFQIKGDTLMVRAQRFYRPGEIQKKGGGTWESGDVRELFYSCHLDEISAISVMHHCVIHLVPLYKPLPDRKHQPGFIVRKFYDHVQQKVRNLTDKDCKTVLPQSVCSSSIV